MAVAEELQIIIDAKVTQAVKNLKNVQKGLGDTGKKANKMGDIFKKLAGPLALGAVVFGVIRLGKEFSRAASDAEEIGSKYATIFRDIRGEAETVAETFAENFGLASSTSKELLGNTADLLTGLGFTQKGALDLSQQVNTLAADLASFSNFAGGTTGASEALTKALLGEAESAKALGIVINQNTQEYKDAIKFYTEVEGKTLLQAKAFTALQFATEQSGNAIGDVARTFESHANVSRRLEESTKSLKEELGKAVNEGMTPMLVATDKLVKSMAEWFKKLNDTRDVLRELAGEGVSAEISLDELQNTLEILNKRTEQLGRGGSQQLKEQIEAIESLIANYDHVHDRINRNAAAERLYANIVKDRAAQAQEIADIEAAARETLLELQFDQLSAEAQQLQLLQEEIDKYATLRSQGADVQALLNELVRQRNVLLEEGNELLEDEIELQEKLIDFKPGKEEEIRLREKATKVLKEEIDTIIILSDVQALRSAEALIQIGAEVEAVEELKATWQDYANSVLGLLKAIGSLQSANTDAELQALKDSGASQDELDAKKRQIAHDEAVRKKKLGLLSVAIDTASAIVEALPNLVLAALAAATGAVQAAAINAVPIPAFATGTSGFIANQPTPIMVGEGAGSERVTVEPTGGSGNGNDMMTLNIDGEQFTGWVQRQLDNRNLRVPRSSLV